MSKKKKNRNTSELPPLTPDFSAEVPTSIPSNYENVLRVLQQERVKYAACRKTLIAERRRHGRIETLVLRTIEQMEIQISDLRSLYISTLKIPVSPLETK